MIFGYNTDVKSGNIVYHVQTEDRGEKNPVIDSVIYVKGRIVDRRCTPYDPAQTPAERLQDMVKHQHRGLVDGIRNGSYTPPVAVEGANAAAAPAATPAAAAPTPAAAVSTAAPAVAEPVIELVNPDDIEADGRLLFRFRVHDGASGKPLPNTALTAVLRPAGAADLRAEAVTSDEGLAEISFDAPQAETSDLLAQANAAGLTAVVKFRLRRG